MRKTILVGLVLAILVEGGKALAFKEDDGLNAVQEQGADCTTYARKGMCCKNNAKFKKMKHKCWKVCVELGPEYDKKFFKPRMGYDKCANWYYGKLAESLGEEAECGAKVADGLCITKLNATIAIEANTNMVEECRKTCVKMDPALKPFFPEPADDTTTPTSSPTSSPTEGPCIPGICPCVIGYHKLAKDTMCSNRDYASTGKITKPFDDVKQACDDDASCLAFDFTPHWLPNGGHKCTTTASKTYDFYCMYVKSP